LRPMTAGRSAAASLAAAWLLVLAAPAAGVVPAKPAGVVANSPPSQEGVAAKAAGVVPAGEPLQPLIDAAAPGAVLRLGPGRHAGPLYIRHSLALVGEPGAAIAGNGKGNVITVEAPDVRIEGLEIS